MSSSRTTLLFVAASLLALACGGVDSTSPSRLAPRAESSRPWAGAAEATPDRAAGRYPSPARCEPQAPIVARGDFGPQGGLLKIGQSYLLIPGGALTRRVTITGSTVGDGSSTINFQPEGLHFRKPAGLVISSVGCSIPPGATPSVVYLGPAGDVLETISADYDRRWRRVVAPIQHFSGYAIAF